MDFDQLRTFLEVAKLGSFSRAGQKVLRSQSAVSAQIRQLEETYGVKLLDRGAKSVRLAPAGEVLLDYAVRILRMGDESLQAVADQATTTQGLLTIGANEATCLYVLPDVFAEYHGLYPQVQISIHRNFSHKVLQRVEDGTIDVGVVTLPVRSPTLKVHSIHRDRLVLIVSSRNPLSRRKSVSMGEIADQALIFPRTGYTRQQLDKWFRPYRSKLRITMELPSIAMIKRFVAADLGVSLISESFARDLVQSGEVRLVHIEDVEMWRELGLVYRRDRSLPRAVAAFISLLRKRRPQHQA